MNIADLISLLNRGAAALETPGDLTADEIRHVAEDLAQAAEDLGVVADAGFNIIPDPENSGLRVEVRSDRLADETDHILFNFTHEGLITDVVATDGDITHTKSEMYDDIESGEDR